MTVYTISSDLGFVDALALGLVRRYGEAPLGLAPVTLLLPTRRACRAVREAFLRLGDGRPLLLPRLQAIGDVEEEDLLTGNLAEAGAAALALPPALPGLRRELLLTTLVQAFQARSRPGEGGADGDDGDDGEDREAAGTPPPGPEQAALLAQDLARLLDQVQANELSLDRLQGLVPEEYATHWQFTLRFLRILTEAWPAVLAEEGALDPVDHRNRLLHARAEAWRRHPPSDPVIAAGSTGSLPATAALLTEVARLPAGAVVLPGLDRDMEAESWDVLEETHPQFALKHLLETLDLDRSAVEDWWPGEPGESGERTATVAVSPPGRTALLAAVLRPAATTDAWRRLPPDLRLGLRGLRRLDCPGLREEARVIALMMRETLETPERTAALVTPDRQLARRVAADLARWDIDIDDSAGLPLAETPQGIFLLVTATMLATDLAPLPLLTALKHPLAAGGLAPGRFQHFVRRLELAVLRGPRPGPGFEGLQSALAHIADTAPDAAAALQAWVTGLADAARPLMTLIAAPKVRIAALAAAHIAFVETLAATDDRTGPKRLWQGDAGEAAAAFLAELLPAAADFGDMAGRSWPGLLAALMRGRVVRPRWGRHPRLHIWGTMEARLQRVDLMILGGLNEGVWPPEPAIDPWMSRPMRQAFGLPLPEIRVGLSAHDFVQAASAPEVVLTRAVRIDGTPTVPSRWLLRLDTVLTALGDPAALTRPAEHWLAWQAALDQPDSLQRMAPPAPTPPLEARPRSLYVTEIETWLRDPYALYAKRILGLAALEPLDADPGAAERGTFIHQALERFVNQHPGPLPSDALARLLAIGREVFGPTLARPDVWAFWWPRFEAIARWFVETENQRRATLAGALCEIKGEAHFEVNGRPFTVKAKADRLDVGRDGTVTVIDYKTGTVPKPGELQQGQAPQLPLEGMIAAAGGFRSDLAGRPVALEFWQLQGGEPPGQIQAVKDPDAIIASAAEGVKALVAWFDRSDTPYMAQPDPARAPVYNDYVHLERLQEWGQTEEGSG